MSAEGRAENRARHGRGERTLALFVVKLRSHRGKRLGGAVAGELRHELEQVRESGAAGAGAGTAARRRHEGTGLFRRRLASSSAGGLERV